MAEIKVQILSDLHLESPNGYDIFQVEPNAPYLALLGDISYVKDDGFFCFLRRQLESHREAHRSDVDWLNAEVECIARLEPHREVLVFTHYCPLTNEDVTDPLHRSSAISSGFMTDLSTELCWKAPVVKVWAFGHTHFNCDFQDENGKRVMSN
ncbi:hypothetical protein MY4038_006163 [Beauveria bassiana]